ncbi:SDR family NAD(P)-dependent oxidoreductase [Paenarthrobacter nicotinovorans]|uniref:SDR family NAD(P)-dependent oxidoreductase n=1 Tax=Paenarthrobacter nicotinovorans TaxID=29320 RepID=UPI00381A0F4B
MTDNEFSFAGKSVVVTGASGGIGSAISLALAKSGARVWLADINEGSLSKISQQVTESGGTARPAQLNVAVPSSWQSLAQAIEAEGPLHGLVNCAGVSFRVGIEATGDEDWQRVLSVNLSGVFYGMKYLAPALAMAGSASIVNIASMWANLGYLSATYGASKWGVRGLTKTGALEFAERGIRVNSIHPGPIDTPLMWQGNDQAYIEATIKAVPMGRYAAAAEVANAVKFLLSDLASYVNGAELHVDGGITSGGLCHRIMSDALPVAMLSAADTR